LIDHPLTEAGQVFPEYVRRLRIRQGIRAFHPDAPQRVLDVKEGIFALERISLDGRERVLALHNLTGEAVSVVYSGLLDDYPRWFDALHQTVPDIDVQGLRLRPYQTTWLVPKQI
jgi:sucrose phosphorylase